MTHIESGVLVRRLADPKSVVRTYLGIVPKHGELHEETKRQLSDLRARWKPAGQFTESYLRDTILV